MQESMTGSVERKLFKNSVWLCVCPHSFFLSQKCHDCRRENISAGLAAYILICFVFSMVYVGLAMVFGFGTGATFDTWSFSFQVIKVI